MPPLSAHVNENRQGLDFKDYGINVYRINWRLESRWGGGWLDHRCCCSQLRDNSLNMYLSFLFPSAPLPSSVWPSLTTAATLLTSPSLSIPSTVLNLRVIEIGQAVQWSLCQIEVKYEAEVQSLQSLQRGIYGRALFTERTVFRLLCICQGMPVFSFTHCFYCFRLVKISWFSVELEIELLSVWLMTCHLLSLWFSHIQTRWNQKTSSQISYMQLTLKVLITGHNLPSQCRPASLVITLLHHWAAAKQVSSLPIWGSIHGPTEPIHLLQIDKLWVLFWVPV